MDAEHNMLTNVLFYFFFVMQGQLDQGKILY